MSTMIAQKLTQFGSGFTPAADNALTQNANTEAGALANLETFISQLIGLITVVGGIFFIINFLLAALNWVTAGGDAGKIQKAREQMIQSSLGLVIMVGSYGIIGLIGSVVGVNILQPAQTLQMLIP